MASGNVDGSVDVVLMVLLPVSKSVDADVDDVAAGQGVDGSVAVDGSVG